MNSKLDSNKMNTELQLFNVHPDQQCYDVCLFRTVPARSTDSPAATSLAVVLVLLLPEGAPVVTVGPGILLPPRTSGTRGLFETGTANFPPQWLLKTTLTSEDRRDTCQFAGNWGKLINLNFYLHTLKKENQIFFSSELTNTKLPQ